MPIGDILFTREGHDHAINVLYNFDGRIARSDYWLSWLLWMIAGAVLIPAGASLISYRNHGYFFACLTIWVVYLALQVSLIGSEANSEATADINCYRDVGAAASVSAAFTVIFAAVIVAITLAFGMAHLVRRWRVS